MGEKVDAFPQMFLDGEEEKRLTCGIGAFVVNVKLLHQDGSLCIVASDSEKIFPSVECRGRSIFVCGMILRVGVLNVCDSKFKTMDRCCFGRQDCR